MNADHLRSKVKAWIKANPALDSSLMSEVLEFLAQPSGKSPIDVLKAELEAVEKRAASLASVYLSRGIRHCIRTLEEEHAPSHWQRGALLWNNARSPNPLVQFVKTGDKVSFEIAQSTGTVEDPNFKNRG